MDRKKTLVAVFLAVCWTGFGRPAWSADRLEIRESTRTYVPGGKIKTVLNISVQSESPYGGYVTVSLKALRPEGAESRYFSVLMTRPSLEDRTTVGSVETDVTFQSAGSVLLVAEAIGFEPCEIHLADSQEASSASPSPSPSEPSFSGTPPAAQESARLANAGSSRQ